MDDVLVNDKNLVSTTRASELSGYSKDYIGQLCREDKLECRRVSGHWYVHQVGLLQYKKDGTVSEASTESAVKVTNGMKTGNVRDDTFSYDGIEYIATSRASELTGYAQDYVGQLARSGEVAARKVGRRWFVARKALVEHKKHNDNLLGAVQSQASGIQKEVPEHIEVGDVEQPVAVPIRHEIEPGDINFNVRYTAESDEPLLPRMPSQESVKETYAPGDIDENSLDHIGIKVPDSQHVSLSRNTSLNEPGSSDMPLNGTLRASRVPQLVKKEETVFDYTAATDTTAKSNFPWTIFMLGILLIAFATAMYFFGALAAFDTGLIQEMLPTGVLEFLRDNYGEILPGNEFTYRAL